MGESVPSTGARGTGLAEAAREVTRGAGELPAAIETGESFPSTGAGGSGPAEAARSVEPRAPLVDGLQHCLVPRHPLEHLDW